VLPCKDDEDRWVSVSPALLAALRTHIEAMDLEGQVKDWTIAQRQLVFPNQAGRITHHGPFMETVWAPLLKKAGRDLRPLPA
jgi:hypothetical protein